MLSFTRAKFCLCCPVCLYHNREKLITVRLGCFDNGFTSQNGTTASVSCVGSSFNNNLRLTASTLPSRFVCISLRTFKTGDNSPEKRTNSMSSFKSSLSHLYVHLLTYTFTYKFMHSCRNFGNKDYCPHTLF